MGDRGDIAEYLLGEVLDAQTPEVRRLLLATSVADMLRPGLTEALGGGSVGRTLALLTRENAFIEPVPEHPGFYRYHPLFRDLLRAELAHESPALLLRLQHAAAAWFASRDMPAQSLGHLVAASDWAAATEEVVDRMMLGDLLRSGGPGTVRGLFAGLPSDLPEPAPALVAATTLLAGGDLRRSGLELVRARQALAASAGRRGSRTSPLPEPPTGPGRPATARRPRSRWPFSRRCTHGSPRTRPCWTRAASSRWGLWSRRWSRSTSPPSWGAWSG